MRATSLSRCLVLAFLSPFIAEVLFGATPVSNFGAIVPVTLIYSSAVLLVRDSTRHLQGTQRWLGICLLASAHAVIEEGLSLRSIFDENLFNAAIVGGRAFGVNFLWTQWTVGYHIVWSHCLPILLAEVLSRHFDGPSASAKWHEQRWLSGAAMVGLMLCYAVGNCMLGYAARVILRPEFSMTWEQTALACAVAIVLIVIALSLKPRPSVQTTVRPAPVIFVGVCASLVAFAWFALLNLPHALRSLPLTLLPMLFTMALATIFLRALHSAAEFSDLHRFALVIGALIPSTAFGFFYVTAKNRLDQMIQGLLTLLTLAVLCVWAWQMRTERQKTK